MKKTVYVVGGDSLVEKMFEEAGWALGGPESHLPDLICFTGGEDIHPRLYGEEIKGAVGIDEIRDDMEHRLYDTYVGKVPMVGICRGGQFLNVMNGGKLIQDHGLISGIVQADNGEGWSYYVHVDHHQGIVPTEEVDDALWYGSTLDEETGNPMLLYAGFYPETKSFCFQPHPEWGHEPTKRLFFNLIEECIG